MRATIVRWLGDYGFAKPNDGAHDVIVHASSIVSGLPHVGAMIECDTVDSTNERRRRKAINVKILARPRP